MENIILLSWFFKICSIVTIYPKQILKQTILKENLLTNWMFLLLMQILCKDCRYLTNWMFVQARRQSWSLPSQDLPFPILADKPNNLSIILIILADENSKHLIVIICADTVSVIRLTCWTSSTPILEAWFPVFHFRFNMFSINKQKQAHVQGNNHIWHLGIFPETHDFLISDIFHHLWPHHTRGEEFQVVGIDDNPSRK